MPLRLAVALLALVLLAVLAPASASAASTAQCAGADDAPVERRAARAATVCLLNAERARLGLRRLRVHRELQRASQRYARDMVTRRFFSHVSPTGAGLLERTRSTSRYLRRARGFALGENLAWGTGTAATPRQVVASWMRSPGHRRHVLDRRFREVGLGIAAGVPGTGPGAGATYASQFGTRR